MRKVAKEICYCRPEVYSSTASGPETPGSFSQVLGEAWGLEVRGRPHHTRDTRGVVHLGEDLREERAPAGHRSRKSFSSTVHPPLEQIDETLFSAPRIYERLDPVPSFENFSSLSLCLLPYTTFLAIIVPLLLFFPLTGLRPRRTRVSSSNKLYPGPILSTLLHKCFGEIICARSACFLRYTYNEKIIIIYSSNEK